MLIEKLGESHELSSDSMRALGQNLLAVGFVKEASELLEKRLNILIAQADEQKLRKDHPYTLAARLDLATVYVKSGRYMAALDLNIRTILNRQKIIFGSHHPDSLRYMNEYVTLLTDTGKAHMAVAYNLDVVCEKEATLGEEHSGTIKSKVALAASYYELGKIRELEGLQINSILSLQEQRYYLDEHLIHICYVTLNIITRT
jgi:hypothetical protein